MSFIGFYRKYKEKIKKANSKKNLLKCLSTFVLIFFYFNFHQIVNTLLERTYKL